MEKNDNLRKRGNLKILVVILTAVIVVGAIVLTLLFVNSDEQKVKRNLKLGNKCLLELDYEGAIEAFEEVLKFDKKNVDAYVGIIESYIGAGKYAKAEQYIEKGYKKTKSEDIAELKEMIKKETDFEDLITESPVQNAEVNTVAPEVNDEVSPDILDNSETTVETDESIEETTIVQEVVVEDSKDIPQTLVDLFDAMILLSENEGAEAAIRYLSDDYYLLGLSQTENSYIYKGYKVFFEIRSEQWATTYTLSMIPVSDKTGYLYYVSANGREWGYNGTVSVFNCRKGLPNGSFYTVSVDSDYSNTGYVFRVSDRKEGNLKNSLLDGSYQYGNSTLLFENGKLLNYSLGNHSSFAYYLENPTYYGDRHPNEANFYIGTGIYMWDTVKYYFDDDKSWFNELFSVTD